MHTSDRLGRGQRGFYFGLGLAVGLGCAAHGAAASVVSTACGSPHASKPATPVVRPAHQARTFVSDGHRWRLTLTRAATVPHLHGEFSSARARGKYVVVFLTAQNVGKAPQDLYRDEDFALTDGQGRQFGRAGSEAQSAATEQYKLDSASDDVQPSFSARVAFVFDVASDARGLTLINAPVLADHPQKLFALGI